MLRVESFLTKKYKILPLDSVQVLISVKNRQ